MGLQIYRFTSNSYDICVNSVIRVQSVKSTKTQQNCENIS